MVTALDRPTRILVVDDEPLIADMMVDMLTAEGYHVDTAANGRLALEKIKQQSYELILSDLLMPELDGFELYRELERCRPDLLRRMIFVSGTTEQYRRFLEETGVPILPKPFELEDLRQLTERALSGF